MIEPPIGRLRRETIEKGRSRKRREPRTKKIEVRTKNEEERLKNKEQSTKKQGERRKKEERKKKKKQEERSRKNEERRKKTGVRRRKTGVLLLMPRLFFFARCRRPLGRRVTVAVAGTKSAASVELSGDICDARAILFRRPV